MHVSHLDHFVLTVADIERSCDFYERVLGMRRSLFGEGRTALHFGNQKINLHPADNLPDPNVRHATPGSADLCFVTTTPMDAVVRHLEDEGVAIITGPAERAGARADLVSVYFHDPDENLVEVANEQARAR
ncbi:MAG: VOC family protein [Alphaproteobacteria bacterium]|nr:VOC family protein [Alphaproteobacteria bacterium]MCB9930511.1 VOC family protein [Alphaproteobacteria bacterium]